MIPPKQFNVLTIFPPLINDFSSYSIIARAIGAGLIKVTAYDIRSYTEDKHRQVDDHPYGGGAGMVMKPEPIMNCLEGIKKHSDQYKKSRVILLSPQGKLFNQSYAKELANYDDLTLICGRYEGVDARVEENFVTDILSIGDFVLTGGEIAAMAIMEAVARLIPGVLGSEQSALDESFENDLLEYPQYTRPEEIGDLKVPDILLSGNHKEIEKWRRRQSVLRTAERRPDLLSRAKLSKEEIELLSLKKSE